MTDPVSLRVARALIAAAKLSEALYEQNRLVDVNLTRDAHEKWTKLNEALAAAKPRRVQDVRASQEWR